MRNDVSFEKTRAFKSKPKLFYEKFFYFVSIALGSLQILAVFLLCRALTRGYSQHEVFILRHLLSLSFRE